MKWSLILRVEARALKNWEDEFSSLIRGNVVWDSMFREYIPHKGLCKFSSINRPLGKCEHGLLGELVLCRLVKFWLNK